MTPEARNHRDFTGVSAKRRAKAEAVKPFKEKSQEKAAAQCNQAQQRSYRRSQEVTWRFKVPSKPTTRGAQTQKSRDQPSVGVHSPVRESWHMECEKHKAWSQSKICIEQPANYLESWVRKFSAGLEPKTCPSPPPYCLSLMKIQSQNLLFNKYF